MTDSRKPGPAAEALEAMQASLDAAKHFRLPDLGLALRDPLGDLHRSLDRSQRAITDASAAEHERRSAGGFARRVMEQIRAFEATLDVGQDVGLRLVSFGQDTMIHVTSLGWIEPSIIIFHGLDKDGQSLQLVQHMSQLSFLLCRAPRLDPGEPRRPIGFAAQDGPADQIR